MATSSITRDFVIKDKEALEKFAKLLDNPKPIRDDELDPDYKSKRETGRILLKQLSSH